MPAKVFTVWFTGLSGSGKSTLARALSTHLQGLSLQHQLLDGDEVRRTICRGLGFSKEDRDENIRRIAAAAGQLNEQGMSAIVAAISPYREARRKARQLCGEFVEVFVDCPLETLKQRAPKGLYRRALAGEIQHFSGISDPYEAPDKPEVHIHSDLLSEEESLERLLFRLKELGYLQTLR